MERLAAASRYAIGEGVQHLLLAVVAVVGWGIVHPESREYAERLQPPATRMRLGRAKRRAAVGTDAVPNGPRCAPDVEHRFIRKPEGRQPPRELRDRGNLAV